MLLHYVGNPDPLQLHRIVWRSCWYLTRASRLHDPDPQWR